ncbi:predicted protein [Paecilomyces variotii No. 5]|uniref:Uncharacterized protein n=1 Tax=Byssochlamys spectabilis (strain No. 5 / NBRC 109023) TaxID=1356009 RepID=V5F7B8_BYSSN|nr:predicted protein [Paecilomyces variotii No. 5]
MSPAQKLSKSGTHGPKRTATELFSLSERTIVVTGATGGMGLALIEAILESGADVIGIDRLDKPATEAWEKLQVLAKTKGCTLTYFECDISDQETTFDVFRHAISQSRLPFRGLVHCAGIGWTGESLNFPINEARKIIDVNLVGTLIAAQVAARLIKEQQETMAESLTASFVFIASMSGYIVNKGMPNAAYAASKAGVQQLTRNLASEWAPSIRVNTISPGVIKTPMTHGILEDRGDLVELYSRESMLGRLSEPDDYRGPAVFLLSDASGYITAADLLVDAGYTAW